MFVNFSMPKFFDSKRFFWNKILFDLIIITSLEIGGKVKKE
jgi:hypothetical protein